MRLRETLYPEICIYLLKMHHFSSDYLFMVVVDDLRFIQKL